MLRVMDGSRPLPRMACTTLALAALVAVTLGSLTLSGKAETPAEQGAENARTGSPQQPDEPAARVANRPDSPVRRTQPALFQRTTTEPPQIEKQSNATLQFRCGDLLRREELAFVRGWLNQQLRQELAKLLPAEQELDLQIADFEQISCDLRVVVSILNQTNEPQPEGKNGSLSVGASGYVIQLSARRNWRELLEQHPGITKSMVDDRPGFELPVVPGLGPQKPIVIFLNDTTVLLSHGEGYLKQWLRNEIERLSSADRESAWRTVQGGLLTVSHDNDIEVWKTLSPSVVNEPEREIVQIARLVTRVSCGVDWEQAGSELGLRLRLDTATAADAEAALAALGRWTSLAESAEGLKAEPPVLTKIRELLRSARVDGAAVVLFGQVPVSATDFLLKPAP